MKNENLSNYIMKLRNLIMLAACIVIMTSAAKEEFTALEKQQISIPTPGLFDHADAFSIDFGGFRASDYSFPLPVGKAVVKNNSELEITTEKGDAVKAMFAGTVRISKHISGHGNVIVIRHDNGLETVYARNAENLVKVGDRVKAGQTIAIVGGEDRRTFLTFYIMVNGGKVNPEIIVQPKSHKLTRRTLLCKRKGNGVEMSVVGAEKKDKNREIAFYPLPGAKVISAYGRRGGRPHTGVDIKTRPNDNILAAFDGEVIMSQKYAAYGNLIKIRHENGLETWYSHNSKNLVNVGDKVKAGQVIALTGQTGRATTAHLHFELHVNGNRVNPSVLFDHATNSVKMSVYKSFLKTGKLSKK